eukprot:2607597-Pyramimonas_sp.AAC.1
MSVRPALHRAVPACQRGFVPERNFGLNALELGAAGRQLSSFPSESQDIPTLFSLDFGHAFLPLKQDYLMLALASLQLASTFL